MLGILRDGNSKTIQILNNLDVDLEHLRRKVEILSPASPVKMLRKKHYMNRQTKTTFGSKVFQSTSISYFCCVFIERKRSNNQAIE
jgi:ATP-dependent Clp protease ATP-binding subunit ClpC